MKGLQRVVCILMCTISLFLTGEIYAGAYDKISVEIPVECTPMKYFGDYCYEISIEPQGENAPMPEENIITVPNGETGVFRINADEPGTFKYKVYEEKGSNKNINYDRRVYYITLFVTDYGAEKLVYSVSVNKDEDDTKSLDIIFRDTERFVLESLVEKPPKDEPSVPDEPSFPDEPSVPEETSVPETSKTVFTGDNSNAGLAATAMTVSFVTAAAVFAIKHRRRDDD